MRAGLALLALAVGGCAMTLDATQLGVPATLAEAGAVVPPGTPFRVTRHPVYFLWGAIPAGRVRLDDVLAPQVGTGHSIANLRVTVRSSPFQILVTALTLGLIAPRSVTLEGVVVSR
jgi:protein-S-isoprenylcysteine O-methyltransferase Ste14